MRRKKLLSTLLVASMVLGLVGCGNKDANTNNNVFLMTVRKEMQ